jgi:hypothetical protein
MIVYLNQTFRTELKSSIFYAKPGFLDFGVLISDQTGNDHASLDFDVIRAPPPVPS